MKTSTSFVIAVLIIMGAGYFVMHNRSGLSNGVPLDDKSPTMNFPDGYKAPTNENTGAISGEENSVIKDGVQYVTITARGGYSPRQSFATAGVPTRLIVKTNSTYDCSAALVIRSLNYRKMLPNTGETIIDVGNPKVGDTLQGVCGMGMYSFAVVFK